MWLAMDAFRRMQGDALDAFGFGPIECPYSVFASDAGWRLRQYSGGDPHSNLLIVAAPIKQPYIWDLLPGVSVVRHFRSRGLRVLPSQVDATFVQQPKHRIGGIRWAYPSLGMRRSLAF